MPVRRPIQTVAGALVAGIALSACFTSTADFASDAEGFIMDDVAAELGVEFTSVECDEPENQGVGTRFECRATDAAGGEWVFDNEISDDDEFTINLDRRP